MLDFLVLKSAVSNYSSLLKFVDGRGLVQMFSAIGDTHYQAAKDALYKRENAKDKKAPVNSAITHLEAAHAAYAKIYKGERYFRAISWRLAGYKDVWTLSLMATCYMYIHELDLAKDTVSSAEYVLKHINNPPQTIVKTTRGDRSQESWEVPTSLINPFEWVQATKSSDYWIGEERSKKFREFRKIIDNSNQATFYP
jgi:hypothetical protein